MIIYKHLKLLLFRVGITYKVLHFIAFYDRNNYKTKKQPHNLQNNYQREWITRTQLTASNNINVYIICNVQCKPHYIHVD